MPINKIEPTITKTTIEQTTIETPVENEPEYKPVQLNGQMPGRIAQERAAQALKKRNAQVLSREKNTMMLPGGAVIPVGKYMNHRYNFRQNWWLGDPQDLLKHPKDPRTGYQYGWARRVNGQSKPVEETQANIRCGNYRPIEPDELIGDHDAALTATSDGVNGKCVYWQDLILVEIAPKAVVAQYDAPVGEALTRLSDYEESFANDVESLSAGKAEVTAFGAEGTSRVAGLS